MCALGCCSTSVLLLGRNYFCGFQFWNDGGHLNRVHTRGLTEGCEEEGIVSMTSKTVYVYLPVYMCSVCACVHRCVFSVITTFSCALS